MTHPKAADTSEGFVRWRLAEEAVQRTSAQTGEALAWLVAAGFLREVRVPGGAPLYSLNSDMTEAAAAFLGDTLAEEDANGDR